MLFPQKVERLTARLEGWDFLVYDYQNPVVGKMLRQILWLRFQSFGMATSVPTNLLAFLTTYVEQKFQRAPNARKLPAPPKPKP
jgi:hypothetical protein